MTALPASNIGAPPRRITPRNPDVPTRGHIVAEMAARMGYPLMPWQRLVADVATEFDPDTGLALHPTVRLLVPRQAGKTRLASPLMALASLLRPKARVWLTAQTQRDAAEFFRLEHVPACTTAFGRSTFSTRWSTGQESMLWRHNAGQIRCFPPMRDALHGKQSDLVVVDEAWAFDVTRGDDLIQAISPTQATRPGAQVLIMSAAGDIASTWLIAQLRAARAAHAAEDTSDVLVEWGVPDDVPDDEAADPALVAAHHPAVGITIDARFLEAERRRMGAAGFVRAYGCRQVIPDPNAVRAGAWPREVWAAAACPDAIPEDDRLAFGIEVSPDRSMAAIVAASSSGLIEVVDIRAGTGWTAARAIELRDRHRARVVLDGTGPASTVADAITRTGKRGVLVLTGPDACTAAAALSDAVTDPAAALPARFRPHPDMDAAVRNAVPRRVGDRWTWDRREDGTTAPVAPLIAAGLAWWGITRDPGVPTIGRGR